LVDYQAKGLHVELLGKTKKEGRECFRLRLTSKSGEISTDYIDATTFLEVAYEAKPKDAPMGVQIVYKDWKPVSGIMVPHTTIQTTTGFGIQRMTIDKVEFNVPMDDARFAAPRAK
jgi:outer membrane lipoprotein-sorting protein